MKFAYRAYDRAGKLVSDCVEAASIADAGEQLRRQGLFVSDLAADGAEVREPGRGARVTVTLPSSPTTAPTSLRNLRLRSVLFEDLRELVVRGAEGEDLEMPPLAPADV